MIKLLVVKGNGIDNFNVRMKQTCKCKSLTVKIFSR